MVSLAATLARRRIYYPRPVATLPDVLMIDVPTRFASKRLALGRFWPIMVETIDEQLEIEAFLERERDRLVPPDLLDERPSVMPRKHLTIAHYRPSGSRWPYLQLCQWPADFTARAPDSDRMLARGAYTIELFPDRRKLEKATRVLLASLDRRHSPHVEIVFPDWAPDPDATPS
ncbi:MAG TPA: hypothetical protein VHE36_00295 [Sphingomicrobium sp.]|jgi:hypothetical protein|nr:hypothetical protein [Sphingomicrobium sp.]